MTHNELLLAFTSIVDTKLKENLSSIRNDIVNIKEDIVNLKGDIAGIKNELHILKIDLIENNVIPRLKNIEQHYVAVSDRYVNSTEIQESLKMDVELNYVTKENSIHRTLKPIYESF